MTNERQNMSKKKPLDALFDFIEQHKPVFVIACATVIFGLYYAFSAVTAPAASGTDQSAGQTIEEEAAEIREEGGQQQAGLSDAQSKAHEKAGDTEREMASLIEGIPWVGLDSGGQMSFDGNSFTAIFEADDESGEASGSLAIAKAEPLAGVAPIEGAKITVATAIDKSGASHIVYLCKVDGTPEEPDDACWYLQSDLFGTDATWASTDAHKHLKLANADKRLKKAFGGDVKGLEKALRKWAAAHASYSTSATWDGRIIYDYTAGNVVSYFDIEMPISGAAEDEVPMPIRVKATYDTTNHGITIEKDV